MFSSGFIVLTVLEY